MLPIDKIKFTFSETECDTVMRGRLVLDQEWRVSRHVLSDRQFDVVGEVKLQIREQLWRRTYGELRKPLRELEDIALKNARPADIPRVQELIRLFYALLSLPKA